MNRHPPNKRLERTRRERASLLSNLGEPLKRNVMLLSYLVRFLALTLVTTLGVACITLPTSNLSTIDTQKARKFSDAFLEDAVNGRQDALYSKMENEFRQITSREKFSDILRLVDNQFGRLTDYTFDHDEIGAKLLFNGKTESTRKIVYKVTTSKGTYQLSVTVVRNGADLAVTDFLFR
jgi:hypothetical protein